MKLIKKGLNGLGAVLGGCALFSLVLAWAITFVSLSYGLAIWSMNWFFNLI